MRATAQTLKTFFSSFGLPAYTTESVPDEVVLPYITYQLVEPEWNQQANMYAQIWYPQRQLADLLTTADQIVEAIGEGNNFDIDGGHIVIYPSTPLMQLRADEYSQSVLLTLAINAYHMPGE